MNVDVLDFVLRPCKTKIACVTVRYYELVMKCDLVFYPKGRKAWVRMPEKWFTQDKKTNYCYWPDKLISDEFQKEVLKKIFDKYDLDLDKVEALHGSACEKRATSKND